MVILGIDPGLASTGYGVITTREGALGALDSGVICTAPGEPHEARLAEIHEAIDAVLRAHLPDAVALEELYFGSNARTAFAVGHGRGVVMLAAGQRGVACASYTPQQVKGAVCGSGRAAKEQVSRMVETLLGVSLQEASDHATDALAVAICHANRAPLRAALAGAAR